MKSYFKIPTIILLFLSGIICQAQVSDTLAYIKSFEANKANYIGQPFSKLLNNMTQLQPKSIWSDINRINTYNSMFKFNNMEDSFDVGTVNMIFF